MIVGGKKQHPKVCEIDNGVCVLMDQNSLLKKKLSAGQTT